jgi:hypothetical protein
LLGPWLGQAAWPQTQKRADIAVGPLLYLVLVLGSAYCNERSRKMSSSLIVLSLNGPPVPGKPGNGKVQPSDAALLPGSAAERGRAKDERKADRAQDDADVKPEPGAGVVGGDPRESVVGVGDGKRVGD